MAMAGTLRGKGINYDTGFWPSGENSRISFEPGVVRRELQIIADDLHCNVVRITSGDPVRLSIAAEHAAAAGLEVWFSPFPCEMTAAQMQQANRYPSQHGPEKVEAYGNDGGCVLVKLAARTLQCHSFARPVGTEINNCRRRLYHLSKPYLQS
jgi:hypothetical protein